MNDTEARRSPTIGHRLLHSLLGAGLAYFGLYVVVHAVLAFADAGVHWSDVILLILVAVAQLAVIRLRRRVMTPQWAASIAAVLFLTTVFGLATLPPTQDPNSYDAWFFGAVTFDLLGLTVLGSFRAPWSAMAAIVLACVVWATMCGVPVLVGAALVVRHVGTLAVGTALALSLRRSNAAAEAFTLVERRRRMEEDVARAREGARRSAVEQVLELAGPTLRAIAEGRRFSAEDRRQMLVLEGALRDQIRTPRLAATHLRSSLDAARRRGVNVLLLDEADAAAAEARARAVAWLVERLGSTTEGGFVGRLRDVEEGGLRVSAVADNRSETTTFR